MDSGAFHLGFKRGNEEVRSERNKCEGSQKGLDEAGGATALRLRGERD